MGRAYLGTFLLCESRRPGELIGQFQRQVNAAYSILTNGKPEIFGGGVNAFSRYENGRTKPPLVLVKRLKVLERHPDLLNEARTA